jgi:Effector protein
MENTGRKATIELYDEENSEARPLDWQAATPAGKPVFHGQGGPINDAAGNQLIGTGLGSDSAVKLNPGLTLDNPRAPGKPMPNDAALFHELTHSKHQMSGTNDCTPKGKRWTTQEEKNTIQEDHPSEADYLQERGYKWHRTSHGTTFARNH